MKIDSVRFNPSFQKKLVANANIISDGKPERVGIYKLNSNDDRYYFEDLMFESEWRKDQFCRILHRSMRSDDENLHFFVMEDKDSKCLGTLRVDYIKDFYKYQDIAYLETCPKYTNHHGESEKKYIGETLLTFATKFFDRDKHSEGISVSRPVSGSEEFYMDKCFFEREIPSLEAYVNHPFNEQETPNFVKLILPKESFDKLIEANRLHTNSEIEMVG